MIKKDINGKVKRYLNEKQCLILIKYYQNEVNKSLTNKQSILIMIFFLFIVGAIYGSIFFTIPEIFTNNFYFWCLVFATVVSVIMIVSLMLGEMQRRKNLLQLLKETTEFYEERYGNKK